MNVNYYVLWKKSNQILTFYLDRYYTKLLHQLGEFQLNWILNYEITLLLQKENKDFLLSPDISSIVIHIHRELIQWTKQNLWNSSFFIDILKREILFFLEGNIDSLSLSKWAKIYGTDIRLTTVDNNPYNGNDSHPDHTMSGWVLGWGDASEQEWLGIYERTFEILKQADEWVYDELNQIIKKIIPLGTAKGVHNSASYKECIGHLYMWFTTDSLKPEMNNLEAIIHESSHNKLNLIMQFDPLILNNFEELFYSPYRPDARHIHGVYLWVHALSATVYVLLRSYVRGLFGNDLYWLEKIVLFHLKNKIWMKVLDKFLNATPLWMEILDEMKYVIYLSDILIRKIGPSENLLNQAKERQKEHFSQVNKNYSYLQY